MNGKRCRSSTLQLARYKRCANYLCLATKRRADLELCNGAVQLRTLGSTDGGYL